MMDNNHDNQTYLLFYIHFILLKMLELVNSNVHASIELKIVENQFFYKCKIYIFIFFNWLKAIEWHTQRMFYAFVLMFEQMPTLNDLMLGQI